MQLPTETNAQSVWNVYKNGPYFLVREYLIGENFTVPTPVWWDARTLHEARMRLPHFARRIERDTYEPGLVESWGCA